MTASSFIDQNVVSSPGGVERAERQAFLVQALVLTATGLIGFGSFALRGMVITPIPLHVHLHAVVFGGWLLLLTAQAALIARGDLALHRNLGWLGALWIVVLPIIGAYTAMQSVELGRVPAFFTPPLFLSLSFLEVGTFAALAGAAILMRRNSPWHRRLILGATIALIGPAWGRLLPMSLLGDLGGPAVMGMQILYLVAGMVLDRRLRGAIHPAQGVVLLGLLVQGIGVPILAQAPPLIALAAALAQP